jgi:molecular chaperone DnaK
MRKNLGLTIGIDLGTSNSCMAYLNTGEPEVIKNSEGNTITPSIVALTENKTWLVGNDAKNQALLNPQNTIFSVKRFIGKKITDAELKRDLDSIPYEVVGDEQHEIRIKLQNELKSPEEISSLILQKLKQDAEAKLLQKIKHAVITVPAYFSDSQRQATKDAGKIAGLEVLRIINEPTAAALAYDLDTKKNQKIAVYDLGGGTLDVTILELLNGLYRVLSTSGDNHLGGDDFDQIIINWICAKCEQEYSVNLKKNAVALQRIREAAEKAKCELSVFQSVDINLPFIAQSSQGNINLSYHLSRSEFENMTEELINRTLEPCRKAIKDAAISLNDLSEVILVGGMTRIPRIREVVKIFFNREPNIKINPDEAVAIGAAVQAGIISGEIKNTLLLDVTPLSLGVETTGGTVSIIIPRNTTVPTKKSKLYSTIKNDQTSVNIKVLQGESNIAKNNRVLGFFSLIGLPPGLAGEVQVEVTFSIDANGIVQVAAKNITTGQIQEIKVSSTSGLSQVKLDELIQKAQNRIISKMELKSSDSNPKVLDLEFEMEESPIILKNSNEEDVLTGDMFKNILNDKELK